MGVQDNTRALVLHDDADETVHIRASLHHSTLTEKRKHICDQLKEIYKLSPDLKRRALKRLFLKYHPDKNLDDQK